MTKERTRILVVEDNPDQADMLAVGLGTFYRYDVEVADRLAAACEAVGRRPDVVLLDLGLPDCRGLETFRRLAARAPDIPIIVLTGSDDKAVAGEAVRLGAQDYLVKGFVDHELVDRAVRYALERHRRQELLNAVAAIGHELAGSLDPASLRQRVVTTVRRLLRARRVALYDGDGVASDLTCTATDGVDPGCQWLGRVFRPGEALVGRAVAGGAPVVSAAVQTDAAVVFPAWAAALIAREGCDASAAVPIVAHGRTLGGLAVSDAGGRVFSEDDIRLLQTLADQAALALDNARLHEETRRRLRDTEVLVATGRTLSGSLDLTETMRRLARVVREAFDADMVGAYLADGEERWLRAVAGARVPPHLLDAFRSHPVPLRGHAFVEEAWRTGRSTCSDDAEHDARFDRDTWTRFPHRSITFVPMVAGDRTIGGLFLVWWARAMTLDDGRRDLAEAICRQAGVAVANARLYDEAQRRRRYAETTASLVRALTATRDTAAVAERTAETVRALFRARSSVVALRQDDGSLVWRAVAGFSPPGYGPGHVMAPHVGITGLAAATGRTLWCADVTSESTFDLAPAFVEAVRDAGAGAVLVSPMRDAERVLGVVAVMTTTGTRFRDDDIELLQVCADTAALAMGQALLDEDRARRRREREVLAAVARSLGASLELDVVLRRIGEAAQDLCGARHASVAVREPGGDTAVIRYCDDGAPFLGLRVEPGKGAGGLVLVTGEPFRTTNYAQDPRITKDYAHTVGVERGVCQLVVPVKADGRIEGLIYVERPPASPFTDAEETILIGLADHAGIAIKNAQLYAREQQAIEQLLASERALRESEARFRATFEQASVGITIVADDGRFLAVNQRFADMLGYSVDELTTLRFQDVTHRDDVALNVERRRPMVADEAQTYSLEKRYVRKDGTSVWAHVTASQAREPSGRAGYSIGIVRDITERKRAEERVRLLAAIVESSPDAMLSRGVDGTIQTWNAGAEALWGYTADEAVGRSVAMLFPEDRLAAHEAMIAILGAGGIVNQMETVHLSKDGRRLDVSVTIAPIRDAAGTIVSYASVTRDITERKRTEQALRDSEEKLRQAYKMEAVGRLAGGIAHDFNNLLTVISGRAQILLDGRFEEVIRRHAEIIHEAAQRAATMTRQLLAFSRKQVLQPTVLDLDSVVGGLMKIMGRLIGEHISLSFHRGPGRHRVNADRSQLEQVLMNLCVNARDAMPNGGSLVIETATTTVDGAFTRGGLELAPGAYVVLAVSDTGCGMTPEVQARVFEPFFTTKGPEHGTGLGLATVYGIVKQSGGDIAVDSELDRGTTFRVFLPATNAEPALSETADTRPCARATETILLVEDEIEVRSIAAEMLKAAGYAVIEARDPEEALSILTKRSEPIALLLTDVVMPGMTGRALAERARAERPEIAVLYMSGYTDAIIAAHGVLEDSAVLLEKPFAASALRAKVREVLDAATPARA